MKSLRSSFFCLWLSTFAVVAQSQSDDRVDTIGPARCHDYNAILDVTAQNTPHDKLIIVIARLGDGETRSNLNWRRLHNVRTYWTEYYLDKRKQDMIVLAVGERVQGHGRVELYVGGKLIAMLKLRRNADLVIGECYTTPEGTPFCDDEMNRGFYPCRDKSSRSKRRR
jgi:hypothetical protein